MSNHDNKCINYTSQLKKHYQVAWKNSGKYNERGKEFF